MVEYKTVEEETIEYGNNNFIEVARKEVIGSESEEGTDFISISKGFMTPDGEKRYKNGLGFPSGEEEVRDFLARTIEEL